jgi:hypothetical protein
VVDIEDLASGLDTTQNADMISTYSKLLSGSESHLSAFSKTLTKYGESLAPEDVTTWLTTEINALSIVGQSATDFNPAY